MIPEQQGAPTGSGADEVSAYLVMVRGGAPFLSGQDSRLLMQWIDQDIPVASILACIDTVASRRRASRPRTRLTLSACKGEVKKLLRRPMAPTSTVTAVAPKAVSSGWDALLATVTRMDAPADALNTLRASLVAHQQRGLEGRAAASASLASIRDFVEDCWQNADQQAILDKALGELAHIAPHVRPRQLQELQEEVARDMVRRAWPDLSAQNVVATFGVSP